MPLLFPPQNYLSSKAFNADLKRECYNQSYLLKLGQQRMDNTASLVVEQAAGEFNHHPPLNGCFPLF